MGHIVWTGMFKKRIEERKCGEILYNTTSIKRGVIRSDILYVTLYTLCDLSMNHFKTTTVKRERVVLGLCGVFSSMVRPIELRNDQCVGDKHFYRKRRRMESDFFVIM